jgi:peroxiredoxin
MLWKLLSAFFLAATPLAAAADEPPLRFHLEAGQELSFLGMSEFRHEGGSRHITDRLTLWVTARNPDGSWHIIGHSETRIENSSTEKTPEPPPPDDAELFDTFDILPDGHIARPPADPRAAVALTGYFFQLPRDAAALRSGWKVANENLGETLTYTAQPPGDDGSGCWIIDRASSGPFNDLTDSKSHARLQFDATRGLLTRAEAEFTQGRNPRGWGSTVAELKSVTQRDADWIARFAREAEIFLKANAALRAACTAASPSAIESAAHALREQRELVTSPLIHAEFDRALAEYPDRARHSADIVRRRAEFIDKPAPQWEATDLNGLNYKLSEFRGKVVILAFWSRGNPWSIAALPRLKEVAARTRRAPVAILGMHTDPDENDARFVEKKLIFNFPTLGAASIAENYPSPAVVIIDQSGIIRAVRTSSGPRLRDDIVASIEALLAPPPIARGPKH